MAPLSPNVLASLITGGASVLGGFTSSYGQHQANQQNLRIAREQNAHNLYMLNVANAYNRDMWKMTNEYNTPLNQRKRFEEAGLNPALMLGQFTPGVAQGSTSATPAPAVGATMQNSMAGIAEGVNMGLTHWLQQKQIDSNVELQKQQALKLQADTVRQTIENSHLPKKFKQEEEARMLDNLNKSISNDRAMFDLDKLREFKPYEFEELKRRIEESVSRKDLNDIHRLLAVDELKNLRPAQRQQMQASVSQAYATVRLMAQQGALYSNQAELVFKQVATEQLRADGIKISNEQAGKMFEPLMEKMKAETASFTANADYTNAKRENISFENNVQVARLAIDGVTKVADTSIRVGSAFATGGLSELFR